MFQERSKRSAPARRGSNEAMKCTRVWDSKEADMPNTPSPRKRSFAEKPGTLDHVQAAAVPTGGITAWQALFKVAQLRAGQKVLIHGAAGGVGNFAVQFGKAKGAYVIGTASSKNQAFLGELGVDKAVDYNKTP